MRPSAGFLRFPQGQKGVCGLRVGLRKKCCGDIYVLKRRLRSLTKRLDLDVSHFDGDLRRCQELLDFVQRLSCLWSILEVDCADAQREVIVRFSKGKRGGGEVPVGF